MSIYTRPPRQPYNIVVGGGSVQTGGGAVLNDQLPFEAATVLVNNPTNQYVFLPDVGNGWYVPPGVSAAVLPLPYVRQARASFVGAPPGLGAGLAPVNGQVASLMFLNEVADPNPGVSTQINVINTPQVTIAANQSIAISGPVQVTIAAGQSVNVTIAAGQSVAISGNVNVTIAAGQSVAISGNVTIGNIIAGTVNVQNVAGNQLQIQQPQSDKGQVSSPNGALTSGLFALPAGTHAIGILVRAGLISRLTVQGSPSQANYVDWIPTAGGGAFTVPPDYVYVPTVSAFDSSVQVSITGPGPGATTVEVIAILDTEAVQVSSSPGLPVYSLPPPPTHASFEISLAAGGSVTLVNAVLNRPHRPLRLYLSIDVNGLVQLRTGGGLVMWATGLAGPHAVELSGFVWPVGVGTNIQLFNESGVAVAVRGFFQYYAGG